MRSNLWRTRIAIMVCFALLFLALGRIQLVQRQELVHHAANRYRLAAENRVKRGEMYDRQGMPLAQWTEEGKRYYPLGYAGSHPIGYVSNTLGSSGAETWFATELLGRDGAQGFKNFWQRLAGGQETGYNIQLTLDGKLQQLAYSLLAGQKGAIVAVQPSTGEILALVSSPGFDPNNLEQNWDYYTNSAEEPLFNRAVSGTYPPGSTFKLVVGAAALARDPELIWRQFECPGYIQLEGRQLSCYKAHGQLSFMDSIAVSCNVVFAQLGLEIGEEELRKQAAAFGFGRDLLPGIPVKPSSLGAGPLTLNGLAESAIGQGKVLATPLQMALVTAAIANDGLLAEPSLLRSRAAMGTTFPAPVRHASSTRVLSREAARLLKEAMVGTVNYGTGQQAWLDWVQVAGKTGSAENPHGQAHAWFVAFAPVESPAIAVAVVVENAGSGGGNAGPIVRELINYYLSSLE